MTPSTVEENANKFGDQARTDTTRLLVERAKEARVKAEAAGNPKSRRLWLETAQALEKLARDLPQRARERAEASQS